MFDGFQPNLSGRMTWDGLDNSGKGVSAGVYIYSLNVAGRSIHKKMLLLDGGGHPVCPASSAIAAGGSGVNVLNKPMSNLYRLRITGENIETYEKGDLTISGNTTLNVTVIRTVTDIDGNVYRTVKIGSQWWMAENLKVTHYRNDDAIPNITDNTEWSTHTTGAYCCYNNAPDSAATWGGLYNWHAATDGRNLAPAGWHVPSDAEWQTLL